MSERDPKTSPPTASHSSVTSVSHGIEEKACSYLLGAIVHLPHLQSTYADYVWVFFSRFISFFRK